MSTHQEDNSPAFSGVNGRRRGRKTVVKKVCEVCFSHVFFIKTALLITKSLYYGFPPSVHPLAMLFEKKKNKTENGCSNETKKPQKTTKNKQTCRINKEIKLQYSAADV